MNLKGETERVKRGYFLQVYRYISYIKYFSKFSKNSGRIFVQGLSSKGFYPVTAVSQEGQ